MEKVKPKVGKGNGRIVDKSCFYDKRFPYKSYVGKYLPHFEQDGKMQFVTLRLGDSLPATVVQKLKEERDRILTDEIEYITKESEIFLNKVDYWLSQGHGECLLQWEETQSIVEEALLFNDDSEYALYEYVIMPNHIHFLIIPETPLVEIMGNLKRYTSRQINKLMGREGSLWQADYFDRMMRNIGDYNTTADYIRNNPSAWEEEK